MSEGDRPAAVARAIELASGGKLLCIVGPTASGKTDLALEVSERIGAEIVSADSIQIYRGFDIGSGKATREERARAPHHLIDTLDPLDPVDAAGWARLAEGVIEDIRSRGKVPIVCGGTFFWVRALVLGLVEARPAQGASRSTVRGRPTSHSARTALTAQPPMTGVRRNWVRMCGLWVKPPVAKITPLVAPILTTPSGVSA